MAIYAIFNVAIQTRKLADVRMRWFYVEKVYWVCYKNYGVIKNKMAAAVIS